ncbi:hypothetical protein AVEN_167269-1 [Araneus ventricosus]|uniref:Uncharacterized protein n=1 Tax=Araneus ventricosus TaxID=182803 RepID=A0A4Y2HG01_ARAVE|nr:hypothetical protein AVEN_167269-1 [Araneus ventricosus]
MKSGIIAYTTLPPIKCQSNYVRPSPLFCNPTNVLELWNKYSIDMSLDYLRNYIEAASWNLALHDINASLEQHGLSCASIGLPVPTGNAIEVQPYNQDEEREEAEQRISSLNREQLAAFETITRAIGNNNEKR